jgi:DNA-binding NtrC family response regulator
MRFGHQGPKEIRAMPTKRNAILIAEPNPHVRRFLQREMLMGGYDVVAAHSLFDILGPGFEQRTVGLIIVDPDFPNISGHDLLTRLRNRIPGVPIIVHTHDSTLAQGFEATGSLSIVEKCGNSIERLKQLADQWLKVPAQKEKTPGADKEERKDPECDRT